ncbi:aldose epimerase family protein [Formosa sp. PL04]|uniref:aldose epimerase family protein n=1 Tax=Formosa sp. PL04 TaxID=3081755 RepID=UPI0029828EA6|nr:aldose epimerase family protein [Formosa sp. PL04]MDW5290650.1 aldose epimerase family protein [Formosa sp. PL04]
MAKASITKSGFGITPKGQEVDLYTLKNANGMQVDVITFGGIITTLKVPNKENMFENVVLGYDTFEPYLTNPTFFGAIIGRYGNRIANGKFTLNGTDYNLAKNNGPNNLHGGNKGFDKAIWSAEPIDGAETVALKLTYLSTDMEEGFPGNLKTTVVYTLTADNALEVYYQATTDKITIVNLTQHSYFNLSGDFSKTILKEEVMIDADRYIPTDETAIPTGELASVSGTPFDFTSAKTVEKDINADHIQIKNGSGFDHCWVLNNQNKGVRLVATVHDKSNGRFLEVATDEPGIQFYTANFLETPFAPRTALCLETQHYPDSPNRAEFPTTILKPGETYKSQTNFKFSIK